MSAHSAESPAPSPSPVSPLAEPTDRERDVIGVMSEFSEVFAFIRSRTSRYAREIHPDLKGSTMLILHAILRNEPITATTLGHYLEMDKAIVSRQLATLRELGLVVAQPDPGERRSSLLRSTELAHERVAVLRQRMREDYRSNLGGWNDEELAQFREFLGRFNNSTEVSEFRRQQEQRDQDRQAQQLGD